jgi:predicted nucleotidyltransferase
VSSLYRLAVDESGLQLDFMSRIHGVRSFESLRSRASEVTFWGHRLLVASLQDIVASKRAAGRERDKAALVILQKTLDEKRKQKA